MLISSLRQSCSKGFSLVEMLVVIAVIGIVASLAIPSVSKINESTLEAQYARNAQQIVAHTQAAQAAGLDFTVDETGTTRTEARFVAWAACGHIATENNLVKDQTSPFFGEVFILKLSLEEIENSLPFLALNQEKNILQYSSP